MGDELPTVKIVTIRRHGDPPPGWYDGTPKRCPGSGVVPRARYMGDLDGYGERMYRVRCDWCGKANDANEPMPEHTFIPVDPDEITFTSGAGFYGLEPGANPFDPCECADCGLPPIAEHGHSPPKTPRRPFWAAVAYRIADALHGRKPKP